MVSWFHLPHVTKMICQKTYNLVGHLRIPYMRIFMTTRRRLQHVQT